mmetsp:Transcript_1692/g.2411  ORF Transcript_1692/g.2411 Transcript_1692/m.2411 type:complete len:287 (+) Transcript_1692:191-1051(+)|eukprot:CAMPEP_0194075726 /NCGR_PEP_ID=MMETSP0149-20130528/2676_1 /TAXON_ID=122233 /ORGANISM="Chaetoceros debilis, Strain MM31A-1" /LENGTH=286 /DNA_ID=CAMNT_0038756285 /DNA_START=205 /DNA_END=1065 /DNA_ORIENTATION=+
MKVKVFRPHLDDVERLSYGKGAKKQRGTGSRMVCHRLNQSERILWDMAKKQGAGYLTVRNSGYRRTRKGSPLCNIYRQRCDALEEISIIVEKRPDVDKVLIDFSTLRVANDSTFVLAILDRVLRAKYPDLHREVTLILKEEEDILNPKNRDDGDDTKLETEADADKRQRQLQRRALLETSLANPIDWDAIRNKPIWGVKERLITVSCDRDVAKSLAMDVYKESQNFDMLEIDRLNKEHHDKMILIDADNDDDGNANADAGADVDVLNDKNDDNDDNGSLVIDWDDI